jgi:hypothetical protein
VPTTEEKYHSQLSGPFHASWASLPAVPAAECAKPVILLLAETEPDFDGDSGLDVTGGLRSPPLASLPGPVSSSLSNVFDKTAYLDLISSNEGYSSSGRKYFYSDGPEGDCTPKTLNSLNDVLGLCPHRPSLEGTYSSAAVAYFARTHTFTPPASQQEPIDLYVVSLSPNYPQLEFPIYDSSGAIARRITLMPAATSDLDTYTTKGRLIGFLNYYIIDWQADKNGTPYHVVIRVNFSCSVQGVSANYASNWDSDLQVEYTFDLVSASQTVKTGSVSFPMEPYPGKQPLNTIADGPDPAKPGEFDLSGQTSGALKVKGGTYWAFKYPYDQSFVIEPSEVAGLIIGTYKFNASSVFPMMAGYFISGSTHDGTYMDKGEDGGKIAGMASSTTVGKYGTPPTCNWPAGYESATANGTGCLKPFHTMIGSGLGKHEDIKHKVWRTFEFDESPDKAGTYLPNPLMLAAKYGGYTDYNNNGRPDPGEWEGVNGLPYNYFEAARITDLPSKLNTIFRAIARSVSVATGTSASIDALLDGGLSVQTLYYPIYTNPAEASQQTRWAGSVYGLFTDRWGNLREDTNHNGILEVENGPAGDVGDLIVKFHSDSTEYAEDDPLRPDCYEPGHFISRCLYDSTDSDQKPIAVVGHPANVHKIIPLFDTGRWLSSLNPASLAAGPRDAAAPATVSLGRRRILYGNPAPSSWPVNDPPVFNSPANLAELQKLMLHNNYTESLGNITRADAAKKLVDWVTGIEVAGWRSRTVGDPWGDDATPVVWRLGDIINSKPILVGQPKSGYEILYGDTTYAEFRMEKTGRRLMAYFGANDGMLHAVNIGFPSTSAEGVVAYKTSGGAGPAHELGAEVWGFIPSALLPHLRWLPDPLYNHAYYVDLKPLVSDIKINGQWRTVLIGGLRLGGRPIEAPDKSALPNGEEHFYSEFFALDVTDPENDPKLLWRFSTLELGLTAGMPSVISHDGSWYAVLPTGPVTDSVVTAAQSGSSAFVSFGTVAPYDGAVSGLDGSGNQRRAKLIVLDAATGVQVAANRAPGHLVAPEANSFFNNPFLPAAQKKPAEAGDPWTNHVLYYGLTVSRDALNCVDSGAVYRLKTVDQSGSPLPVSGWELRRLFQTDRPVTGAVNSAYDSKGNLWVVFGTGRFWSDGDVTPCLATTNKAACEANHQQYIFGIKEELNSDGLLTFRDRTLDAAQVYDVSGFEVYYNKRTDTGSVKLPDGTFTGYTALSSLVRSPSYVGYRRRLNAGEILAPGETHAYELVFTQPKIMPLGNGDSVMAFTSFEPTAAGCGGSGYGYLYMLDTFTGLPLPSTLDVFKKIDDEEDKADRPGGHNPGVTFLGDGPPTEAFVTNDGGLAGLSQAMEEVKLIPPTTIKGNATRLTAWREVLDSGFDLTKENRVVDLE